MADEFTTDVTQWQGVDEEPTALSKNLIESNVVGTIFDWLFGQNYESVNLTRNNGYINDSGSIAGTTGTVGFYSQPISMTKFSSVIIVTSASSVMSAISEYNNDEYTPILLGKTSAHKMAVYTFTANKDMQIVISGYGAEFGDTVVKFVDYSDYSVLKNIYSNLSEIIANLTNLISKEMPAGTINTTPEGKFLDVHTFPINKFYQVTNSEISSQISNKPEGVIGFGVLTFAPNNIGNTRIQILYSTSSVYFSIKWSNSWTSWIDLGGIVSNIAGLQTNIAGLQNNLVSLQETINNIYYILFGGVAENVSLEENNGYINSSGDLVGTTGTTGSHSSPISVSKNTIIVVYTKGGSSISVLSSFDGSVYTPLVLGKSAYDMRTYTYFADKDMQIVVSCLKSGFADTTFKKIEIKASSVLGLIISNLNTLNNDITILKETSNFIPAAFDNIVSVGDSLTFSAVYIASDYSRQAYNPWPKIVKKVCGLDSFTLFARRGDTSKTNWNRYKDSFAIPQEGKTLCTIFLGTNGYFEDTIDTSAPAADVDNYRTAWADDFTGCMCKIIQTFINLGAKVLIIRPRAGGTGGAPEGWTLEDTNEVLRKICVRFNVPYIDAANMHSADKKYHYYPDLSGQNNLHYNDLGYAYFASKFLLEVGKLPTDQMKLIIPV